MVDLDDDLIRWIQSTLSVKVERSERLIGGMSSDVHHLWCNDGSDFVIRHISDRDWLAREPSLIDQEVAVLDLLAASDVPAPRHVMSDSHAGLLLMTFLPGAVLSRAEQLRPNAKGFADIAAKIAAVELPNTHRLSSWRSWAPDDPAPPDWGEARLWRDSIDAFRSHRRPDHMTSVLLHRDLHPLNVLWTNDRVTGVVDWVNACVGHPHADLGHCRWNLSVLVDAAAADALLSRYLSVHPGQVYNRWWDLAAAMSFLPGPIGTSGWLAVGRSDLTQSGVVESTELFVKDALENL